MLTEGSAQVLYLSFSYEDFALSVDDEFLQVIGDSFGEAVVLGLLGHLDSHVFAHAEEVLYGEFGGENDAGEFVRSESILSEFLLYDRFDMDEWSPVNFNTPFLSYVKIGGSFGFRLRNQDGFYLVCLLYTSPSPRDQRGSRMPSSA